MVHISPRHVTCYCTAVQVELVVVGDDCALEGKGLAGRRGIAGTVFVHKVGKNEPHSE